MDYTIAINTHCFRSTNDFPLIMNTNVQITDFRALIVDIYAFTKYEQPGDLFLHECKNRRC